MSEGRANETWWAAWPVRYPRATLLSAGVVAALSVAAVTRMSPTASLTAMFPERHASARAMASIVEHFAATESLLVLVTGESTGREGDLVAFAARFEAALRADIHAKAILRDIRYRLSPEFRRFAEGVVAPSLVYYLDGAGVEELRHRLSREGIEEQMGRNEAMVAAGGTGGALQTLLGDPLRLSELVIARVAPRGGPFAEMSRQSAQLSRDGKSLLIQVTPARPVSDMDAVAALMDATRVAVDRAAPGGLRVEYAGGYAIAELAQIRIRRDMIGSVVGSIVALQVVFLLTYRGLLSFPLAFAPVVLGTLVGFAVTSLVSSTLTPPTAVIGAILAGLGIDYCAHYLSFYHAHDGAERPERVARMIGPALLAGCVTSVFPFAAIGFSDIPAMRDFAMIGAVGLLACFLATLTLLPAVLSLRSKRKGGDGRGWLRWTAGPLVRWLAAHARISIAVTVVVFVVAVLGVGATWDGRSILESDLSVMHPQPNEPLRVQGLIAERFTASPDPWLVHLSAASPEELVHTAHEVRRCLEGVDGVAGTFGLGHLLPDPVHGPARLAAVEAMDADRVIGDFNAVVEASVFSAEAMGPYTVFLRSILRPEEAPSLRELFEYPDLAAQFLPKIEAVATEAVSFVFLSGERGDRAGRDGTILALREALAGLEGVTLTGLPVIAHDAERAILGDLGWLLLTALGLVALWLVVQFRSVLDAALTLLPVLFGAAVVVLVMQTGGVKLNMVNLIVIPLLIGLGVDYGIYLVDITRQVRRSGGGREELLAGVASSCHAVIIASASTILGFGSVVPTSTPAIRSFGVLLVIGVAACLFATLAGLLPLLLILADRREGRR